MMYEVVLKILEIRTGYDFSPFLAWDSNAMLLAVCCLWSYYAEYKWMILPWWFTEKVGGRCIVAAGVLLYRCSLCEYSTYANTVLDTVVCYCEGRLL